MKCLNELRAEKKRVFFHTLICEATNPFVSFGHYHNANLCKVNENDT